jgi:hypothetical protein
MSKVVGEIKEREKWRKRRVGGGGGGAVIARPGDGTNYIVFLMPRLASTSSILSATLPLYLTTVLHRTQDI